MKSWKQARRYGDRPHRSLRARTGAVLVGLIGVLCLLAGYQEGIVRAGLVVEPLDWIWASIDIAIPTFYLYALSSFAQRDELESRLAAAARTDPLTGLPNRAGFATQALALLDGHRRSGHPATLVMFDIDRFKLINDGWGHHAGDQVLAGVARAARASIRTGDIFARFGGEEFILLMADLTPDEALPLVERIRAAIAWMVRHPGAPEHRVTISAGLATVEGNDVLAVEDAAKRADGALYMAKAAGRDRAVISAQATA